jgi:hypothetical protein
METPTKFFTVIILIITALAGLLCGLALVLAIFSQTKKFQENSIKKVIKQLTEDEITTLISIISRLNKNLQ